MNRKQRNDVLINGALMALGALAIIDNVVAHWVLELHRVYEGEWTFQVELALVALGTVLLVIGLWREVQARSGR
jgi:uncharacterized membrane protein